MDVHPAVGAGEPYVTPVVPMLRNRTLETEADLRALLGDEEYQRCRTTGAEMPVVDVVQAARSALLDH